MAEKFARDNSLIFIGESSAQAHQNVKEVMDALLESKNFSSKDDRNIFGAEWIGKEGEEKGGNTEDIGGRNYVK